MNPLIQSKTTTRIASNSLNRAPMQRALVLVPMALTCTFRVTWRRIWDSTLVAHEIFPEAGSVFKQPHFAISRQASQCGGFLFCSAHRSLKSPLCSCVSITLPASS
jgi:hypothetical protein